MKQLFELFSLFCCTKAAKVENPGCCEAFSQVLSDHNEFLGSKAGIFAPESVNKSLIDHRP